MNGERTENERRTNGERTENDTGNIPLELLGRLRYVFIVDDFQKLIIVNFETFLLDNSLYKKLQKPSAYKDFTAEYRTFSDVLFENYLIAITLESGKSDAKKIKTKLNS